MWVEFTSGNLFFSLAIAGKVKAIGVSNFLKHHLEELVASCTIKPAVLQVIPQVSLFWTFFVDSDFYSFLMSFCYIDLIGIRSLFVFSFAFPYKR